MPIKPFSFPQPETRFFHTTKYVYKFKIRYGVHFCSEDAEIIEQVMSELLDSVRAILANHDNLQPFSTKHFLIFPYKSKWGSASRLKFKHGPKFLKPYPYVFTVYVEPYTSVCDNEEDHISGHSDQLNTIPCPTLGHDSQDAGGFMDWLRSFTLLRYLFGRRRSE
ncbi:membrane-anchored junction protein [Leptodactylus fuscus]|uniref:membrane-anchored junction protein n=1 Tax=Leptodactylus fuscus TaxID=238119 RepID=UPI003F4EC46B